METTDKYLFYSFITLVGVAFLIFYIWHEVTERREDKIREAKAAFTKHLKENLKPGDFVIVNWFLRDQIAEVRSLSTDPERSLAYIYVMPLMVNRRRYRAWVTGFDFLALKHHTYWEKIDEIIRMGTPDEISYIRKQYLVMDGTEEEKEHITKEYFT